MGTVAVCSDRVGRGGSRRLAGFRLNERLAARLGYKEACIDGAGYAIDLIVGIGTQGSDRAQSIRAAACHACSSHMSPSGTR